MYDKNLLFNYSIIINEKEVWQKIILNVENGIENSSNIFKPIKLN